MRNLNKVDEVISDLIETFGGDVVLRPEANQADEFVSDLIAEFAAPKTLGNVDDEPDR